MTVTTNPPVVLLSDKLLTVNNLTTLVLVKLDVDKLNYSSWVRFFKVQELYRDPVPEQSPFHVVAFATSVNHPSAIAALHALKQYILLIKIRLVEEHDNAMSSMHMGVKFDPQNGSTLHIELARSNSRRKNKPGSDAYVVIDKRSKVEEKYR
ncbi:hypothetical protein Tco_0913619, partial [Tanacetum coccineum]